MDGISKPHSMDDLKRLTDKVAELLGSIERAVHEATLTTPEDAAGAAVRAGTSRRAHDRIAGPINSALSGLEAGLKEVAADARVVYEEAVRVHVPKEATW